MSGLGRVRNMLWLLDMNIGCQVLPDPPPPLTKPAFDRERWERERETYCGGDGAFSMTQTKEIWDPRSMWYSSPPRMNASGVTTLTWTLREIIPVCVDTWKDVISVQRHILDISKFISRGPKKYTCTATTKSFSIFLITLYSLESFGEWKGWQNHQLWA